MAGRRLRGLDRLHCSARIRERKGRKFVGGFLFFGEAAFNKVAFNVGQLSSQQEPITINVVAMRPSAGQAFVNHLIISKAIYKKRDSSNRGMPPERQTLALELNELKKSGRRSVDRRAGLWVASSTAVSA
jgi:hypothetical protein